MFLKGERIITVKTDCKRNRTAKDLKKEKNPEKGTHILTVKEKKRKILILMKLSPKLIQLSFAKPSYR